MVLLPLVSVRINHFPSVTDHTVITFITYHYYQAGRIFTDL